MHNFPNKDSIFPNMEKAIMNLTNERSKKKKLLHYH